MSNCYGFRKIMSLSKKNWWGDISHNELREDCYQFCNMLKGWPVVLACFYLSTVVAKPISLARLNRHLFETERHLKSDGQQMTDSSLLQTSLQNLFYSLLNKCTTWWVHLFAEKYLLIYLPKQVYKSTYSCRIISKGFSEALENVEQVIFLIFLIVCWLVRDLSCWYVIF